jgi:2-oxoglutarate ferredoxin oxidoreductase subunit beta
MKLLHETARRGEFATGILYIEPDKDDFIDQLNMVPEPLGEISFVPYFEDINVEYEPGSTTAVKLHDGSQLYLRKVAEDYNPSDKISALRLLHETARRGEFATGIIYIEPDKDDFIDTLNLVDTPLAMLPQERVRPGQAVLDEIMEGLR